LFRSETFVIKPNTSSYTLAFILSTIDITSD
jgi:hypothetical protein